MRLTVEQSCPSWQILEPRTREDWFGAVQAPVGGAVRWSTESRASVGLNLADLEHEEVTTSLVQPVGPMLKSWMAANGFDCSPDPTVMDELSTLLEHPNGYRASLIVVEVGLASCGILWSGRVRIRTLGAQTPNFVDLRPFGCSWEAFTGRTVALPR